MLFIFLVHSLLTRAAPIPAVEYSSTSPSCKDIDNCRTLLGIIWSCITSVFLCTWVAIHPNIPEPLVTSDAELQENGVPYIPEPVITRVRKLWDKCAHKISHSFGDKILLFICALLVPEYILAWAIRQHIMARWIVKKHADLGLTQTHGFFIIMGGFHRYTGSDKAEESYKPEHPLTWQAVIPLLKDKTIGLPNKEEIQDKGKSDWFAKTLVLLQTLWFVTQCIARHIEHLPTTELEIVTLAYTTINFGIFLAWWDKPRNVKCPIRVFQHPIEPEGNRSEPLLRVLHVILGSQDDWVNLHEEKKVPVFYSGYPTFDHLMAADGMTLIAGVVFGAIHCIAWSFEFATPLQVLLWRLSAVAITAVPALLPFIWLSIGAKKDVIDSVAIFCTPLLGLLYITARLITVVLAFINLSSLPHGAFETVHWTTLIPHL